MKPLISLWLPILMNLRLIFIFGLILKRRLFESGRWPILWINKWFTKNSICVVIKFMTVVQKEPSVSCFQRLCHRKWKKETWTDVACEHSCFSLLLAAREFRQEERLCLSDRNSIPMTWIDVYTSKSGSHGVSNANLFDYMYLVVDYGKVLCSTANELQ